MISTHKSFSVLMITMCILILANLPSHAISDPGNIIKKVDNNYSRIKDASADITLDTALSIFGCTGMQRQQGKGFFKSPDKIKAELNQVTYFAQGNSIRKIDEKGKRFYVQLINAIDFSAGFNIRLIPYNFNLALIKDTPEEIIIEGIPKPGILKNAKKVSFYFDPRKCILSKIDVKFENKRLPGKIVIDHVKIGEIWVPVGFHGESAVELQGGILVGLKIKLKSDKLTINQGLPDKLFDPGF